MVDVLHALRTIVGISPAVALLNVLSTSVFGVWLGPLVLAIGSVWPAVVLHAASNAIVPINGLSSTWLDPVSLGYIQATLFDFPVTLIGLWMTQKVRPPSYSTTPKLSESAPER
ncbi:MAG: hypothetical protein PVH50_06390 [Anaerolineae bacterium]